MLNISIDIDFLIPFMMGAVFAAVLFYAFFMLWSRDVAGMIKELRTKIKGKETDASGP